MPCCHADFALTEDSDKAFTIGMPTFTFGAGCLAEAGEHARELGLTRVALFTDAALRDSPHVATVLGSLKAAGRRRRPSTTRSSSSRRPRRSRPPRASPPKASSTATCRSAAAR